MTHNHHEEDGMGFSGLAPTAQERAEEKDWETRRKIASVREQQLADAIAQNKALLAILKAFEEWWRIEGMWLSHTGIPDAVFAARAALAKAKPPK